MIGSQPVNQPGEGQGVGQVIEAGPEGLGEGEGQL